MQVEGESLRTGVVDTVTAAAAAAGPKDDNKFIFGKT